MQLSWKFWGLCFVTVVGLGTLLASSAPAQPFEDPQIDPYLRVDGGTVTGDITLEDDVCTKYGEGSGNQAYELCWDSGSSALELREEGDGIVHMSFGIDPGNALFQILSNGQFQFSNSGAVRLDGVDLQFRNGAIAVGGNGSATKLDLNTDGQLGISDNAGANSATIDVSAGNFSIDSDLVLSAGFTHHLKFLPGAATVGVTAPSETTIGTYRGLAFDADAEVVYFNAAVPNNWDSVSDMTLKVYWSNEPGAALSDTETVKWDVSYRSTADGEDMDAGTATTATATYTQSGTGTDGTLHRTDITIDYDDANQPLADDDTVGFSFDRDFSGDTYGSDAVVVRWEVAYNSTAPAEY